MSEPTISDLDTSQRLPREDLRGRSRNVRQGDKGARTRELIKDSLIEIVSRKNAQDIVLDDICQQTGLTVGAFYFHFKNKDAALEEVSIDALHSFYDQLVGLPATDSVHNDIKQLCETMVTICSKQPLLVRLMAEGLQIKGDTREAWVAENTRLTEEYTDRLCAERGGNREAALVDVQFMIYGLETYLEHASLYREPGFSLLHKTPEKLAAKLSSLALRTLAL